MIGAALAWDTPLKTLDSDGLRGAMRPSDAVVGFVLQLFLASMHAMVPKQWHLERLWSRELRR